MRLSRLFVNQPLTEGSTLTLESAAAHYLRNVLRLKKGFKLTVFNGQGGEYAATVVEAHRKAVRLQINEWRQIDLESSLQIELGLSVSRGERMDVAIQKATELGVKTITPVLTQHCVVKLSEERRLQRHQHWQNIIYRACEQCGRNILPKLNITKDIDDWLKADLSTNKIIFEPNSPQMLKEVPLLKGGVALFIGPEGGFSEREVLDAEAAGFTALGFGPRVVRNETAAIAAIAAVQVLWGDMG